jgi:uncharacterized protein (DUF2235 family)
MKRIVICADGTWNERDHVDPVTKKRRPTNVTKTARAIKPRAASGVDQIVIYHEGVGTSGGLDKWTGGAFGDGIEDNVRQLYRAILYNYEPGDELFLFGFSRGAFTVRTLAGFMNLVGLIQKDDDYWLPEIYSCYEQGKGRGSLEWAEAFRRVERQPRECPPILFIGVWDTVGALGAPGILGHLFNSKRYKYHDVNLNSNISHAYQALAIDEQRKPFAPSVWERPPAWAGTLEQAWFAGVHSDVGGSETPDGLANEALHWMLEKAEGLGLEFDSSFLSFYRPCFNSVLHDSMTTMYRLLGTISRPIGQTARGNETPHQAAMDRIALAILQYAPSNLAAFLKRGPVIPAQTTRVPRGKAC